MGCQYFAETDSGATGFTVAMPRVTFGRGSLGELGPRCRARGLKKVALLTDPGLADSAIVGRAMESLHAEGIDAPLFSDIRIEPCDDTVRRAGKFLAEVHADGLVSVGGGSVIDTAKAALLVASYPGDIVDYFAPPVGSGKPVPGPVPVHLACPTTCGTGSESTSITVLRINAMGAKFVFASPYLLPDEAIVDPACCDTLPANVIGSTGFDLCCHALECYTARPFTHHAPAIDPGNRQFIQGANPFSDLGACEALRIVDRYLERGVTDRDDAEARDQLMWGATLAGIAFGNSGTHLPHAMSYGITHLMNDITTDGYGVPSPFIPHGISVIVNAPAIFRYLAAGAPERHLDGAHLLGADALGAGPDDAGEVLSRRLVSLMQACGMPNGISALGFGEQHLAALTDSSIRQKRAIANAPRESNAVDVENLYRAALSYW